MGYLLLIPIAMFVVFVAAMFTAAVVDYCESRRRSKDIFYQLGRDHNERKRPAAK